MGWAVYRTATSGDGEVFEVRHLDLGSSPLTDSTTKIQFETVAVIIPVDYMRRKLETGFSLSLVGKNRSNNILVAGNYVNGFLEKLDSQLLASNVQQSG